jgi:hypothetical protein
VTAFLRDVTVDVYALAGHRAQPVPEAGRRFGFGVPTRQVVDRGDIGDQAMALRVSGTGLAFDWGAHVYGGLSRRPTFVPRFTADRGLASVDAVYSDILQVGGELETTVAAWRLGGEGFSRSGAVDVWGQRRTYTSVAGAAEYQRFGAFSGAYHVIPRVEVTADTRGDRADLPFASSIRAGMRITRSELLPLQVQGAYSYDWVLRGHGVIASAEKALVETPSVNLGFRFTKFVGGDKASVLDIWERDVELYSYFRIELWQ